MLHFRIKSFGLWKAKYDYMISFSIPGNIPAFVDIIFTLLNQGQSVIKDTSLLFSLCLLSFWGHAVAQLVEALRYKSEGRGFDSRWCHWNFSLT